MFFVIIFCMSKFIWVVEINPNGEIDTNQVEAILYEYGLHPGVKSDSIDTKSLENKIMLNIPQISWMAINLTGSIAEVEISVADPSPEMQIMDHNDTSVLVASKAGQVVLNQVYSGTAMVSNGDVVAKGQLLVNSNFESELGDIIQTGAYGKVFATVRDDINIDVPFEQVVQSPTGDTVKRRQLEFFNLNIPLSLSSVPDGIKSVSVDENTVTLLGRKLPISITEETWSTYDEQSICLTEEEAYNKAKDILNEKLDDKISEFDATILDIDENVTVDENKLTLNASVFSKENIAVRSNNVAETE